MRKKSNKIASCLQREVRSYGCFFFTANKPFNTPENLLRLETLYINCTTNGNTKKKPPFPEIDHFLQNDFKKNIQNPGNVVLAQMCLALLSILLNVYFIFSNFIKIQTSNEDKSSLSKNIVGLSWEKHFRTL